MEFGLFDQVADGLRSLVPDELGTLHTQARRWGIKAWVGPSVDCPRVHYEAQVLSPRHVPGAEVLALEVGLHAEHPKPADNAAALAGVFAARAAWSDDLGPEAEAGDFIGRDGWLRISETWADPDLSDPEICFELTDRLATYITVLEPIRAPR